MMEFNEKQINELLTGVILAQELPNNQEERHFVTVRSFNQNENGSRCMVFYLSIAMI